MGILKKTNSDKKTEKDSSDKIKRNKTDNV